MKILIFSYFDKRSKDKYSFEEIAKLTLPSKEEYCKIHGYDFINYEINEYWREIGWYKIDIFKEKLKDYDWIVYIEADAMVCNQTIRLENLIQNNLIGINHYNLIISKNSVSKDTTGINCGVMAIKNCEWSEKFLNELEKNESCWHHNWAEQQAIIDYLFLNKNELLLNSPIKFVNNRFFNSYIHQWYKEDNFRPGDFIIHAAGCSNEYRYNLFNYLKDKIIKIPDYKIPFEPFI